MSTDRVQVGVGLLSSPVRRDVVDTLASLPWAASDSEPHTRSRGLTAAELAVRLGLHVTTIRFHVDQLVAAGVLVTRDVRAGVGRPRRYYAVAAEARPTIDSPDAYRVLASMLADALSDEDRPTPSVAGERWLAEHRDEVVPASASRRTARTPGAWLAKIGIVIDLLSYWGYSATIRTTDDGHTAEILFHDCPLRSLALDNPSVVCGVHHGVVKGALTALGEDAEVELQPFIEPNLCLARVTTRATFSHQGGTP